MDGEKDIIEKTDGGNVEDGAETEVAEAGQDAEMEEGGEGEEIL